MGVEEFYVGVPALGTVRPWFCCVPVGTREVLDCVASDADDVTDEFGVFKRPIRVLRSLFSAA
jgi:hypothetical protein